MRPSNQPEAAPLDPPKKKKTHATVLINMSRIAFHFVSHFRPVFEIYETQYKTSELLGIELDKFYQFFEQTLNNDLHINAEFYLYPYDFNSGNMIIASFFGRKLALNIPVPDEFEEVEIQEEYEEVDLLTRCVYPLHTALVICYVSHTMKNVFIRKGFGFQLEKYERLKNYYEQIACDIVNHLYYQDQQDRVNTMIALQSTYNHHQYNGDKFGEVKETMAVAFKAEAMKFLSQKPCLSLMEFRHQLKDQRFGLPILKIKFWFHAVFRVIYVLMFAYMLCRSPVYSYYEYDRSYDSIKQRKWIEESSVYVISALSAQLFVSVLDVLKMLRTSIKLLTMRTWFHTFGAGLKYYYGIKRLSVWRTISIIFLFNLEAIRFVLSALSRKNVQKTAYTGLWVLVPILLELLYYLIFMITTLSSLRFLSSFKSLGFFSLFIRKMFKTVSMFVFIFCMFWFVLAVTHVGLSRSFTPTNNTFVYTITSIGKFEIFGNVKELDSTGSLPDCSSYKRTIYYFFSMDYAEASCLFRSTLLPFLVFVYIFVSTVLLVPLLTAQLSKEYDEEYKNSRNYHGYLKYDELSKIEAKLFLPPPLSIFYVALYILLFILRLVFKLLKLMRIGGWCDTCYQFLLKNVIERMEGDLYQQVKIGHWERKDVIDVETAIKQFLLEKLHDPAKCVACTKRLENINVGPPKTQ
ncbi:unnamed protein product [Caenorhabditis brenneri]